MKEEIDYIKYQPKPLLAMVEGRAVGGPRDNIKLTASPNWDGIVMQNINRAYDGRYKWDGQFWIWQDEPNDVNRSPRARGAAHHKRRQSIITF